MIWIHTAETIKIVLAQFIVGGMLIIRAETLTFAKSLANFLLIPISIAVVAGLEVLSFGLLRIIIIIILTLFTYLMVCL
jgi:hypothetical protein